MSAEPGNKLKTRRDTPVAENVERFAWLDSLRGVAVLGVVLVHSGQTAHVTRPLSVLSGAGQYGVQLFFFISAITISLTYQRHISRHGSSALAVAAWLVKRLLRIAPLYYLAAAVYSVQQYHDYLHLGSLYAPKPNIKDITANLLFINTWVPSANNSVVPGGWSISVEAMFYLVVPFLMQASNIFSRKSVVVLSLILISISELTSYSLHGAWFVRNNTYFYYWFPTQAPVFLVGCMFYFSWLNRDQRQNRPLSVAALAFVVLVCIALFLGTWRSYLPMLAPTVFAVAFCCLAIMAERDNFGIVANRWLARVGDVSFSIYLCHFLLLDIARSILTRLHVDLTRSQVPHLLLLYLTVSACAFYMARWSRRYIELPGIKLGRRLSAAILKRSSEEFQDAVAS